MSIAYQIYTALLPQATRELLEPLHTRFHIWKEKRKKEHRLNRLKRRLSTSDACRARRKKLHNILTQRPLNVAFQVAQLGKWKCESVLQQMMQDSRFRPCIWSVPVGGNMHLWNPEEHERETNLIVSHFAERGIKVYTHITLDEFPVAERPDLIFIHEAYDYIFSGENFRGLQQELLCYVPYAFRNSNNKETFDGIGNNCAVLDFVENESFNSYLSRHSIHKGRNSVVTGTPLADIFMGEAALKEQAWKDCGHPMKKVIWAPHWTITPGICWFVSGTFLKNAEAMLELAEQHCEDIQFAFKPHPHLYRTLCDLPEWGKEKTDAFYRRWQEMPNTQLEQGPYTALFMQSDAIIHDSGSFILEYLFADKPCMFLRENEGYGDYNEQTSDCLKAYQYGLTKEDIESFLRRCVLGTEDPLKEHRNTMRHRYLLPPHGKTAAQNIIDAILQV